MTRGRAPPVSPLNESIEAPCEGLNHCRTTWNIVLNCTITVLGCTWIAIHPNMSYPIDRCHMSVWKRQIHGVRMFLMEILPIFILVFIFPEFILAWSLKQRFAAELLSKRLGRGATRKHGFFVIMGGFHYFVEGSDEPYRPIHQDAVVDMVMRQEIDLPTIEEIEDKNKNDLLASTLVLAQTAWFIMQCIARATESIHVTKIEILTIAYIVMNLWIYVAWWDKPRRVNRPIRISIIPTQAANPNDEHTSWINQPLDAILGYPNYQFNIAKTKKIPMYYSGNALLRTASSAGRIALLAGGIFAAISSVAWSYESPSITEVILWRLCSLAIFKFYLFAVMATPFFYRWDQWFFGNQKGNLVMRITLLVLLLSYVLARITSIILAFNELKAPPSGTHEVAHWTLFMPHI